MAKSPVPSARRPATARLAGAIVSGIVAVTLVGACSSSTEITTGDPGQVSTNPIPGSSMSTTTTVAGATTKLGAPSTPVPSTSTTIGAPPIGSSTSIPTAVSVPVSPPTDAVESIETQVFWIRGPGDDRVIDLPGYRDPVSGPKPLVLYGSVTNVGTQPVVNPFVTATWLDASGTAKAAFTAPVLAPGGTDPVAVLEPGAMADVLVVIIDADQTGALRDLAAELRLGSQ
jgi:hypothetical protein